MQLLSHFTLRCFRRASEFRRVAGQGKLASQEEEEEEEEEAAASREWQLQIGLGESGTAVRSFAGEVGSENAVGREGRGERERERGGGGSGSFERRTHSTPTPASPPSLDMQMAPLGTSEDTQTDRRGR